MCSEQGCDLGLPGREDPVQFVAQDLVTAADTHRDIERHGGDVVGAIGVSGGTGDQDQAAAEAGAAAF